MQDGWIKLHRKLLSSAIIKHPKTVALWIHLLLKANHQQKTFLFSGKNITLNRGQLITGQNKLSDNTGLSVSEVKTAIKHLKTTKMITKDSNKEFSIITINNYDLYQGNHQHFNQEDTQYQTVYSHDLTTNNNDNNDNNENNENNTSSAFPHDNKNTIENFITSWSTLYESETKEKFKIDKKDYLIITNLLKQYGHDILIKKTKFLFTACKERRLWFTKGGIADFSIGKLLSRWNELIESNYSGMNKFEQTLNAAREVAEEYGFEL